MDMNEFHDELINMDMNELHDELISYFFRSFKEKDENKCIEDFLNITDYFFRNDEVNVLEIKNLTAEISVMQNIN